MAANRSLGGRVGWVGVVPRLVSLRLRQLLIAAMLCVAGTAAANITSTSLRIEGTGLAVVNDPPVTTGIDIPTTVQTKFGNRMNDEAPAVEGLVAVGELTGPGLETPIPLTTAPGHKFQIPGLPQAGVYYLQNIRLMKGGDFLQYATPATTQILVADLLQTKVTVRQLSADELRARGIVIDARNFDVYEFSFTFIIDGKPVVIPFPVVVDPRTHEVQPVRREVPYTLPGPGLVEPPRWTPPEIIPLDFFDEGQLPEPGKEPKERTPPAARPSIPAAIMIPNSMAVLHQFFAVTMMVTNGAPAESAARLENIRATMRVSDPGALRTVKTLPEVSFGQPVPVVEPESGTTFLVAQARGEAQWTLEGLRPGTHRLDFDLRATLTQQGQDDLQLRATPSAAIVIHDPRFNITFSHPDVVRKGLEYSTYAFITNLSESEREVQITTAIPSCDNAAEDANVCRLNGGVSDLLRIPGGGMRLVEYRLRPGTTGQVFATAGTLSDTDVLSANVRLHMGVSPSGIPLSPATLILPYYAQFVAPSVVSANLELFGLGYSLATAPLSPVTAQFPRVIKTDVYTRAVDVSRAGQRIFITNDAAEAKRDSIMHLALDLLGNGGYELREWDALRRREESGRKAGAAVMRELEATALTGGATMSSFIEDFARVTAHRQGYVATLAHGAGAGDRPYAILITGTTTGRVAALHNESTAKNWKRDLPYADISSFNGAGERGELALVGRWTEDLEVRVTPAVDGPFAVEVIYPHTSDGRLYRARFTLTGTAGTTIVIPLTRGASSLNALGVQGGIAAVGTVTSVEPDVLRVVGARQDLHLETEGHKVSLLFNRPVKPGDGVDLRTRFTGRIDFNADGVTYTAPRPISAAALQEDARTVNLTFDHTLSTNATYAIDVASLVDPTTGASVPFSGSVVPKIDNDKPAGILYGKVVKGDGTPISGVDVVIRQYLPNDNHADPQGTPQYDVSQANGAFLFEFVRRQTDLGWTGQYRLEGISSVHGHTSIEGAVRLPGKVHFVNLQYLGRGAATGRVTYNDGSVVANAKVVVGSTMFDQFRSATTNAEGKYEIADLPVGPLTFSAQDAAGNVTFAANEIATPGQIVTQNLSIFRAPFPGTGRVYGVVRRSDTDAPVAGARVGIYSQGYGLADQYTDSEGRFDFQKVPAGFVTLLAAEFSVAPQAVAIDFDLKADEVRSETVRLFVAPPAMKMVTLNGTVTRERLNAPGTYEPVAGALVKISGYKIVTAGPDGKFVYENLPSVFSQRNITAYDPVTQRVKSVQLPTLTEAGPNNVAITIAAADRGTGTIRVRLLNAAGKPVTGYRVIERGFPPDVLREVGPGVYEMANVSVGPTHEIWAVPSEMRPDTGPDTRPYGDQVAKGNIAVAFNGHIAALTLRFPGQGTVRAKVRSQLDLVSDVNLTYSAWYEPEQAMVPLTITDTTLKNGLPDYAVFDKIPALSGYHVSSAHPQHGYAGRGASLAYDGDLDEHVLQLNTLAKVSGTVYAIDGITPIAGATVRIYNGRSDPGPQLSGPDGRFEFFDQPSSTNVWVTAEVTQNGVYRIGTASARTPSNGGVVENMAVMLRRRGFVDGKVVYKNYKKFDADNPANNIPDDTPNDYSDNAPVPLAKFHLRELDYPGRTFGTAGDPLVADVGGRFLINNVFVGALRATAWDSGNEELRGSWAGSIDEEGAEATPKAYIAIGDGGVGSLEISVVDPNQAYLEIENADVGLYAGGGRPFDFTTTGIGGKGRFDEIPVGTYTVSAYSKSVGKTSRSETVTITRDAVAHARLELEFSGTVDGTLVDPEDNGAPVPGSHVRLTASSYQTQSTTDVDGKFLFLGVREGTFTLNAKDTDTNRRASASRTLSVSDPHRTVTLELEPTETLYFAAFLPDDTGGNSRQYAPPQRVELVQRCYTDLGGKRHCDYERQLQGNPIEFPGAFENSGYTIGIFEPTKEKASIHLSGSFPKGTAGNPYEYVYPAYGDVHVNVTQGGAAAAGARVTIYSTGKNVTVYTDANGFAIARGLRLGNVSVTAKTSDEKFTGTQTVKLERMSVPAVANIALGAYAGVTGRVLAEVGGGVSAGTRVIAHYNSFTGETRTDEEGRYTFLGIPTPATGTTTVNLTFVGPDDNTVGGFASKGVKTGDTLVTVADVRLDATRPSFEAILPADGSINVSPDTNIKITFSEALNPSTINSSTFQLIASDGSGTVSCALTHGFVNGLFTVTMTPPKPASGFPLKSNTLYRVVVTNVVKDLTGHALPATLGFGFTTTDYAEPRVQKVSPASPIPRATTFEFRFNEPIAPAPWLPGGNGDHHVYKLLAPGGAGAAIERELDANTFLDPNNIILYIGLEDRPDNRIEPESFYRVTFSGVKDPQGNELAPQTYHFSSFDEVAPHVVFTSPAEGETLVLGSEYVVTIDLRNGGATGTPATDIREVKWYTIGADDTATSFATATQAPYSVRISPNVPAGSTYTLAAEPLDTSGNRGPLVRRTWTVRANAAPTNVVVTPLQAAAYPSNAVSARVTFQDEGTFASVQGTFTTPKSDGTTETVSVTKVVNRSPGGAWPDVVLSHTLPLTAKPGDVATVSATVSDVHGLKSAPPATATIDIAPDAIPPQILSYTPANGTQYTNTQKYTIVATVKDTETAVQSVTFLVDGTAYATASTQKLADGSQKFTSVQIETKSKAEDATIPVAITAKDYNGNTKSVAFDIFYKGVNDPAAPKVTWLCPTDGGAIPANAAGFPLKLRLRVVDQDIREIKFVIGGVDYTNYQSKGNNEYELIHTLTTPAPGTMTITAIVKDTVPEHTIELPITLDVVAVDLTLQDTLAITAANVASYNGKSIALIGGTAALLPQVPLTLKNLLVLNGGRVATLAADVNREFRLDVTTAGITYVDCDSSVNVTTLGYAGGHQNTSEGRNGIVGRTVGNTTVGGTTIGASGTHAGIGGPWLSGGVTNAPYGFIAAPTELGTGGAGIHECCRWIGGAGGGAARLRGGMGESDLSRIVIGGTVTANGGAGINSGGGGSGGSIWLDAKHVLFGAKTAITANGGDDDFEANPSAIGGGGGRIAIAASTKLDLQAAVIEARGGRNHNTPEQRAFIDGGAGTILIRKPGQEAGELVVSSYDSRFPSTAHTVLRTPIGRIGRGTSTALSANALTDSTRTFDRWTPGEELVLGGVTTKSFTVVAVSADGKTLQTDPADGSMLLAAGSQAVAYSGLVAFDKVTAGKRALVVFDQHVSVGGAVDDKSVIVTEAGAAVLLAHEKPTFASTNVPAAGSNVIRDTSITITYTASSAAGIASAKFEWSLETTPRLENFGNTYATTTTQKVLTLPVPQTAPLGAATLLVTLTDLAGRTTQLAPLTWTVVDNTPAVIESLTIDPGLSIYPGRDVTARAVAVDDLSVRTMSFASALNGTALTPASFTPNVPRASQAYTVNVAKTVAAGSTLVFTVTANDGFPGHAAATATQTVTILQDAIAPLLTVNGPAAGTSYRETFDKVAVRVAATDAEVDVKEVFAQFDGGAPVPLTRTGTTTAWAADIPAPPVEGDQNVQRTLTITAKDYAGNETVSAPIALTIRPIVDGGVPILTLTCASSGAIYPTEHALKIRFSATSVSTSGQVNPLESVEVFLDDATASLPVTTLPNNQYEVTYTIPATTADGTEHSLRFVARSAGGVATEAVRTFSVAVPNTTAITANTTIDAANTSYDDKTVIVKSGTVTIRGKHRFDRLVVLGGTITTIRGEKLEVETIRGTYFACSTLLDLNGKGYAPRNTYPNERLAATNGGASHMGRGGWRADSGSSYGSVYRPQELGAGEYNRASGGGAAILQTDRITIDGTIRVHGENNSTSHEGGAAGGSVWIRTKTIHGNGTITAHGGNGAAFSSNNAGGGAIAVHYTDPASTLPSMLARSGDHFNPYGGAGTVYVHGPQSTFGDLTIDNTGRALDGPTELPPLGNGIAQPGTAGNTLFTGAAKDIQPYFAGHWVEITDAAGTLKGTWRIATVSGTSILFEADAANPVNILPGDRWQGVYRFDNVSVREARLYSKDPIRTTAQVLNDDVHLDHIHATNLTVKTGTTLKSYSSSTLTINVANEFRVESGAVIDQNGQGYAPKTTYPDEVAAVANGGASHMGHGGWRASSGTTYGSVYFPREAGAGEFARAYGGGVVRIDAKKTIVDGTIRANGQSNSTSHEGGAAGGSVWITTGSISGSGTIQAEGGDGAAFSSNNAGGGAIAIHYTDPASALPTLSAKSGDHFNPYGGAGTIYLFRPTSTFGDLIIDNTARQVDGATDLPSLGSGVVAAASADGTITAAKKVQPYFVGHWVEVRDASGALKGTWRIGGVSGNTFTLAPNASETISLAAGDRWQGVYRFDNVTLRQARLISNDPIRSTRSDLFNEVLVNRLGGTNVTVKSGATLYADLGVPLVVDIDGDFVVEANATITMHARGYAPRKSYPGETVSANNAGASHIGWGGTRGLPGSSYGSIYRPQEMGAGEWNRAWGGGAVRIKAAKTVVNGVITVNGQDNTTSHEGGAAGGSVWITTGLITGTGQINALGGKGAAFSSSNGAGGAIAVEYTDPTSTLPAMNTRGGDHFNPYAGAGSIYVRGPQSTYGELTVDNKTSPIQSPTILPSLGRGRAVAVNGTTITVDRLSVPPYFAGHWLDVFGPGGALRGTWRIASVTGNTLTLEGSNVTVLEGDTWRGVYLFDRLTLRGGKIFHADDLRVPVIDGTASLVTLNDPPALDAAKIAAVTNGAGDFVTGSAGAVTDADGNVTLFLTNVRTSAVVTATPGADGSFTIPVTASLGDAFVLHATDRYGFRSATLDVNGGFAAINGVESVSFASPSIAGGNAMTGSVRMRYPVRRDEGVVTLASSSAAVSVPATVTVPAGSTSVAFTLSTAPVANDVVATITASAGALPAQSASVRVLGTGAALATLTLQPATVTGGESMNAEVVLGAPAPAGGAVVLLRSSDTRFAALPDTVLVPEGTTSVSVPVTTFGVAAQSLVTVTATYGSIATATATLNACTALGAAPPPASVPLDLTWLDDALPTGATQSGDGTIDSTQAASGAAAIHLSGAAAGVRAFAFTGAAPVNVAPTDNLVFYVLTNPCNPPRELVVAWSAGTTEYARSWGESRITNASGAVYPRRGSLPRTGEWTRFEVLAKSLGITAATNLTGFSVRALDGEAWIDAVGKSACAITQAPPPGLVPAEQVWFDDELPAGAVLPAATSTTTAWTWSTAQAASGTRSHHEPLKSGFHEHYFSGATDPLAVSPADVLYTYVYLDPCNPPRMIQLQFNDGSDWAHRAYWGENLSPNGGSNGTADRFRAGPLPPLGQWVRLEVPASALGLDRVTGISFGLHDGQAWFDRAGRIARVNVALRKSATQSSDYTPEAKAHLAVDGDPTSATGSMSITKADATAWWEVDLGEVQPIDAIDIVGRTDCCTSQTGNLYVLVSDVPFASTNLTTTIAQAGVSFHAIPGNAGSLMTVNARRTGRYVRLQKTNTENLSLPEVRVWAPVAPARVNLSGGRNATASSQWDSFAHPRYAVNGVVNSAHASGGSIYHVRNGGDVEPWWEVDLGSVQPISTIDVWERIEQNVNQHTNLYIFVSDVPFASKSFAATRDQAGVSLYYQNQQLPIATQSIGRTGRYIRFSRPGTTATSFSFAEVFVWGQQPTLPAYARSPEDR